MADQVFSDNISRYLRMSGILRPNAKKEEDYDNPIDFNINEDEDAYDPTMRMRQLYQPETRMSDKFFDTVNQMPERNKPGLGRKILGGLYAVGGGNPDEVLYAPHKRAMEDWEASLKPITAASNIERQNNANERMMANQVLSQEMSDRRLQRQVGRDRTLEDQANQRIKQAETRLDVSRAIANGGQVNVDDSGAGRIIFKDGTTKSFDGTYLSAEEKAQLRQQYPTSSARDRVRLEVIDDPEKPGTKIAVSINLDTNEVTRVKMAGSGGVKTDVTPTIRETETSIGAGVNNRALQAKNSNPTWSKYIEFSKSGKFTRIKPVGYLTGPSKEMYDQISQAIYGRNSQGNTQTLNAQNQQTVRVRRKADGKTGSWDLSKGPVPSTYERIQ